MARVSSKKDSFEAINAAIANIEKQMGNKDPEKFVIKRYGDIKSHVKYEAISFGIPEVDSASNMGGVPRGKLIEIFGPESGGKSFLTLKLISAAQKAGLQCMLVDAEQSFDPLWASKQGVDPQSLWYMNDSLSAEEILDYVIKLSKSGQFGLIVVDSTAALIPKKELEGSITEQDYALLARAMSKACKQIVQYCGSTNTTCAFINQIREKMNSMPFADNTTTPGGKALRFYSHQRIRVTPGAYIREESSDDSEQDGDKKKKGKIIAKTSYVTFVKNKTAVPNGECQFNIVFDKDSLNPVVKLCNLARKSELKAIGMYKGIYTINKEIVGEAKNLSTDTSNMRDLTSFIIDNNLVVKIISFISDKIQASNIPLKIDEDILDLKADPTKIKKLEGTTNVRVEAKLIDVGHESESPEEEEKPEE